MEEHVFEEDFFGRTAKIIVYNTLESVAKKAAKKSFNEAKRLHKIFNFYDKKSEISKLNKKRSLRVSKEFIEVLTKALEMSKKVKDYDISKGKEFLERKKDKNLKTNASYKDIKIIGKKVILQNPEILIDLGSVAKGYITDKMGEVLKKEKIKEFVIDSRGDLLFGGLFNHVIEIEHPRKPGEKIGAINVFNEAVATSGDYKQFVRNFENSHIINKKEIISATIVSKTLEEADLFATAVAVASKEEREKLLNSNPQLKYFLVDKNLKITKSKNIN